MWLDSYSHLISSFRKNKPSDTTFRHICYHRCCIQFTRNNYPCDSNSILISCLWLVNFFTAQSITACRTSAVKTTDQILFRNDWLFPDASSWSQSRYESKIWRSSCWFVVSWFKLHDHCIGIVWIFFIFSQLFVIQYMNYIYSVDISSGDEHDGGFEIKTCMWSITNMQRYSLSAL